jgi:hypothetical protein
VVLTRWSFWTDVKLLAPLWPAGDTAIARAEKERVIDAFYKASLMTPALAAELWDLQQRAAMSKARHSALWELAQQLARGASD